MLLHFPHHHHHHHRGPSALLQQLLTATSSRRCSLVVLPMSYQQRSLSTRVLSSRPTQRDSISILLPLLFFGTKDLHQQRPSQRRFFFSTTTTTTTATTTKNNDKKWDLSPLPPTKSPKGKKIMKSTLNSAERKALKREKEMIKKEKEMRRAARTRTTTTEFSSEEQQEYMDDLSLSVSPYITFAKPPRKHNDVDDDNDNNNKKSTIRKKKKTVVSQLVTLDIDNYRGWDTIDDADIGVNNDDDDDYIYEMNNNRNTSSSDERYYEIPEIGNDDINEQQQQQQQQQMNDNGTLHTKTKDESNTIVRSSSNEEFNNNTVTGNTNTVTKDIFTDDDHCDPFFNYSLKDATTNTTTEEDVVPSKYTKTIMKPYDGRKIKDADYAYKLARKRLRKVAQNNVFSAKCRTCPICRRQFGGHSRMISHVTESKNCFHKCDSTLQLDLQNYINNQKDRRINQRENRILKLLTNYGSSHQHLLQKYSPPSSSSQTGNSSSSEDKNNNNNNNINYSHILWDDYREYSHRQRMLQEHRKQHALRGSEDTDSDDDDDDETVDQEDENDSDNEDVIESSKIEMPTDINQ